MEAHYPFTLPPLPYDCSALEPELDAKTLYFHHDKHFAAYVDNLNRLVEQCPLCQRWSLERLCQDWPSLPGELRQGIRNNAGGVYNHDLYFKTLSGCPPSQPCGELSAALGRDFGDVPALKAALKKAALGQFGSGWAYVATDGNGTLSIHATANQDTPLPLTALVCCDVWEHAYYLQYQNRRADYFEAWWRRLDWPAISRRYSALFEETDGDR